MGKRTADNQINKDNFQKVFSEGGDGSIQYGFQKASAEVLKTRRKVAAKIHQAGSGGSAGFGGGGAFGGVNLIGGISKPPAAAPSLGFMLPLHAPVPAAATAKQVNEPSAEEKQKLSALTKQYLDHIQNLDPRIYDPVGTERFLISYQAIKHPRTVAPAPAEAAAAPVPAAPAPATSGPFSGSTAPAAVAPTPSSAATGNLFSGGSTTPTFSFGGTMATAAAAAGPAPATGLFAGNAGSLFGGSPAPAAPATSVLSLFPAPAPVTTTTTEFGGFATAPSPAVAAAAAASATETGEDDEVEEATEKPLANPDANVTVAFESVLSKVFRNVLDKETQKSKREVVASGNLKLERNNTTGFCQLVLRDGSTGVVKFNIAISKKMPLLEKKTPKGKACVETFGVLPGNEEPELYYITSDDKNLELFGALRAFADKSK